MNKERKKEILSIIIKEKQVTVKDLAKRLYISEPSIRRDLCELEKQKLLRRVHGGAIIEENSESILKIPFLVRELEDHDAKDIIAKRAAELVNDGDVIMLDASSSAYAIIPFLSKKSNITVITSGVKALIRLGEYGINAYSTGGHLLPTCYSLTGSDALDTIGRYNADILFFSCRGLSPDGMVTDLSMEEDAVRIEMIKHSKKAILLCAGEKINKGYMHNICSVNDIDGIITDIELPENIQKNIRADIP